MHWEMKIIFYNQTLYPPALKVVDIHLVGDVSQITTEEYAKLICYCVLKLATFFPAILPNTRQSVIEQLPRRDAPCTPPVTSPAAYNPLIMFPSQSITCVLVLILIPPIVK